MDIFNFLRTLLSLPQGESEPNSKSCPEGSYCPKGSVAGVPCEDGTWAGSKGKWFSKMSAFQIIFSSY